TETRTDPTGTASLASSPTPPTTDLPAPARAAVADWVEQHHEGGELDGHCDEPPRSVSEWSFCYWNVRTEANDTVRVWVSVRHSDYTHELTLTNDGDTWSIDSAERLTGI
ncbi:MAG: hypothetical protein M0R74_16385, partial [Dehalococcoidia bacterium]|nr:hypothetical protein [Dehalococcoidia bacterium]